MSSPFIAWEELLTHFRGFREAVILELSTAQADRQLWAAQGKLALLEELLTLRETFDILAQQREQEVARLSPLPVRTRATQVLGVAGAERYYGKDKGSQVESP